MDVRAVLAGAVVFMGMLQATVQAALIIGERFYMQ